MRVVSAILVLIFILIILFIRKMTKERGGPVLNGFMQIGDLLTWIRFIGGILGILLVLFIFLFFHFLMNKNKK